MTAVISAEPFSGTCAQPANTESAGLLQRRIDVLLADPRISLTAVGLWLFIASRPDGGVTLKTILQHDPEAPRAAVRRALRALRAARYPTVTSEEGGPMAEAAPPAETRTLPAGPDMDIVLSMRPNSALAALSPENLQTLLVLAACAIENDARQVSAETVAAALQVDRATAIQRLDTLCAFRWKGRPIAIRVRAADGRWTYTIEQGGVMPGGHSRLG